MKIISFLIFSLYTATSSSQEISQEYLEKSFERAAKNEGVSVELLRAICWAESNHNPSAYVFNDGTRGNHSFGICQVLYTTALDLGMKKDPNCWKDFRTARQINLSGAPVNPGFTDPKRNFKTCRLFGPLTNITYAAKYLKSKLRKYGGSWINAIAAYNTGSLKTCKSGKVYRAKDRKVLYTCQRGGLLNQRYVDRVLEFLAEGR